METCCSLSNVINFWSSCYYNFKYKIRRKCIKTTESLILEKIGVSLDSLKNDVMI